jgi:cytochrome c-type biogenesis protein
MGELLRAFSLGNAAILTNACLLPLYPGLIAFLAERSTREWSHRAAGWFGLLVLAGILTMMLFIGLVLYLLNQSFGNALGLLLPVIYAMVITFGVFMLLDRNPFSRLATARTPVFRNPHLTAYAYGLLFGPMTLPCTGPIILSAFALGAGDIGELINGLLFFLAFGLGFGWPLALLPLVAMPVQRRLVRSLARNHLVMVRASGMLLVAVGLFGILTELLPHILPIEDVALAPQAWLLYWTLIAVITLALGIYTYRRQSQASDRVR